MPELDKEIYSVFDFQPDGDFRECYLTAKKHLEIKSDGGLVWQKAWAAPPFLEHLSFGLGNQKFFIRLYDIDGQLECPPNEDGTVLAAEQFNGIACYLPMQKKNNTWNVVGGGWGLFKHANREPEFPNDPPVNPTDLITDEQILLNDAEFHQKAVSCYLEMLMDKLPDTTFYPPQFDYRVHPALIIRQQNKNFDEMFSIFAYRSNEQFSEDDKRKSHMVATTAHLMEMGIKHYVVDVKLISEKEIRDEKIDYSPLCRLEPCASVFTKLEILGLL